LLEERNPKTTNVTIKTQEWRIVSARKNLFLQKGAQAHQHSKNKEQAIGIHFYS
jgi:hypothetical protein